MLVIEFLVLLLIAYELFIPAWQRRISKQRKTILASLLARGQDVVNHAPVGHYDTGVDQWSRGAENWMAETADQLSKFSENAAIAFSQGEERGGTKYPNVAVGAWLHYGTMQLRLRNLRRIIEQPNIYY